MSEYLTKAAELLDRAAAENERLHRNGYKPEELVIVRERIAKGFMVIAAIDKGLLPSSIAEDLTAELTSTR